MVRLPAELRLGVVGFGDSRLVLSVELLLVSLTIFRELSVLDDAELLLVSRSLFSELSVFEGAASLGVV